MTTIDEHLNHIKRRKYCSKCPKYTVTKALLNDTPAIITWLLGSIIMFNFGLIIMLVYILSCVLYIFGFSRLLCTYCPLYGTISCPTKFGDIAAKLFVKIDEEKFSQRFKTFIPFLSLLWFVPFVAGVFLLISDFSWFHLGIIVIFFVFGFVLVPVIPMLTACKKCPVRRDCPWMQSIDKVPALRSKLVAYQNEHNTTVICPTSGFQSSYCPLTFIGRCRKLEDFLKTGEWE